MKDEKDRVGTGAHNFGLQEDTHPFGQRLQLGRVSDNSSMVALESVRMSEDSHSSELPMSGDSFDCSNLIEEAICSTLSPDMFSSAARIVVAGQSVFCAEGTNPIFPKDPVLYVEFLARLCLSDRVLSPLHFLDEVRCQGLMFPFTQAVLKQACEVFTSWHASGASPRAHAFGVNVSAGVCADRGFVTFVMSTLQKCKIPCPCLYLELTERERMRPDSVAFRNLRELQSRGVNIVLDDFGSEHSSFPLLLSDMFTVLKVDRTVVSAALRGGITKDLFDEYLGIFLKRFRFVVLEGIETSEQDQGIVAYRSAGRLVCSQGYYYGRPELVE